MPTYEYACDACGGFDALRPIAERDAPCACPACGAAARRALFTAPALSRLAAGTRQAFAVNERSAHAPQCRCSAHAAAKTSAGAKSFPARRPWMISH